MPLGAFYDIKEDSCSTLLGRVMPLVHRTRSGWGGTLAGNDSPETFLDEEHLPLSLPSIVVAAIDDWYKVVVRKGRQ